MAEDAFSYEGTDALEGVTQQLQKAHTKDATVRLLKETVHIIEGLVPSVNIKPAVKRLAAVLSEPHVLQHTDQGIQIYVSACFVHTLRITAPEAPFSEETLQSMFSKVLHSMDSLQKPSAPCYRICLSILHTISKVKCMLLVWDLCNDAMVETLFQTLLNCLNARNQEDVEHLVFETLSGMIEEADDIPQCVIDVLFECIAAPESNPVRTRAVERLLKEHEGTLGVYIQKTLSTIIENSGEPYENYHKLILQVHQAVPQLLLPILPHLSSQLVNEDEEKRMAAVQVVGNLFSKPDVDVAEEYPELLTIFLGRFKDQRVDVRLSATGFAADVISACTSSILKEQVLEATESRLSDPDERVRAKAVNAVCLAGAHQHALLGADVLRRTTARLNDVKLGVRKEASNSLATLFRSVCAKTQEGTDADVPDHFLNIPECFLRQAAFDPDQGMQFWLETLLQGSLFPASIPSVQTAMLWVRVHAQSDEHCRNALAIILCRKARFQEDFLVLLEQRQLQQLLASSSGKTGSAGVQTAVACVAEHFPDKEKAHEQLVRLMESKDNNVFRSLEKLAKIPDQLEVSNKLIHDLLTRVPTRSGAREFVRTVTQRLLPSPLHPEHFRAMLQTDREATADVQGSLLHPVMDLVTVASSVAEQLLQAENKEVVLCGCKVLAHSASCLVKTMGNKQLPSAVLQLLSDLCSNDCERTAKYAARALAKLCQHDNDMKQLCSLMRTMSETISEEACCSNQSVLLQSISSIAQHRPGVFAPHAHELRVLVLEAILVASPGAVKAKGSVWAHPSEHTRQKCKSIKLLARALSPLQAEADVYERLSLIAKDVLMTLDSFLDPEASMKNFHVKGAVDQGHMRLSAASAMLRLLRVYDSYCPPQVYVNLSLTLQDPIMEARSCFLAKVVKTAKTFEARHKFNLASKYMAMLSLSAMDPSKRNRQQAEHDLQSFICRRRKHVRSASTAAACTSGSGGVNVPDQPDFILPYSIFILAHHPDFPEAADLAAGGPKELDPWQKMTGFALNQLLADDDWNAEGSSLPAIMKILSTVKQSGDALAQQINPNVCTVSDIGLALCGGKGDLREIPHFPAKIPLPRALYQPADREQLMSMKQIGSHLPTGFKPIYIKSGPSSKQSGRRPGKTAAAAAKVVGKRDIRGAAVPVTKSVPHESVQGKGSPEAVCMTKTVPSDGQSPAESLQVASPKTPQAKKCKMTANSKRDGEALKDIPVNRTPKIRRSARNVAV